MRVVLGDDHVLLAEALAVVLARNGHVVVAVASTPLATVSAVAEHDPDVCLLDIHFPTGSGLEVLPTLRHAHPRTKVLVLTADRDPGLMTAAVTAGAAGFVRKDQPAAGIVRALERVHMGELVIDEDWLQATGRPLRRSERNDHERLLTYLTHRERQVLRRIVEGESTKQIARSLNMAQSTARTHAQNVLVKLGAHSRLEVAAIVAGAGRLDRITTQAPGERERTTTTTHLGQARE
jgi:two-component system nitrate/nitrite response regulator NarL